MGDLLQPARPDAIRAPLVFLYLLEGKAERVPKLLLAHCKHHAAHAYPAANVSIDGVKRHGRDRSLKLGARSSRRSDIRGPDSTSNFWTKSFRESFRDREPPAPRHLRRPVGATNVR